MKPKSCTTALALQFNGGATPFTTQVTRVGWTRDAIETLRGIQRESATSAKRLFKMESLNLPYLTLRTRLNVCHAGWVTLSDDVGLSFFGEDAKPVTFGHLHSAQLNQQTLHDVLSGWLQGPFAHFAEKFRAPQAGMQRLRKLLNDGQLVEAENQSICLYPWGVPVGTSSEPYPLAASEIASCLAGHEIFPDLGPVYGVFAI